MKFPFGMAYIFSAVMSAEIRHVVTKQSHKSLQKARERITTVDGTRASTAVAFDDWKQCPEAAEIDV